MTRTGGPVLVYHNERADGIDSRLLGFLAWWSANGPFPIVVAPDGGVRTLSRQLQLFAQGVSAADSVMTAPHLHGGALDVYPAILGTDNVGRTYVVGIKLYNSDTAPYFEDIARAGEALGLESGLRWRKVDADHLQVSDWASLSVPPERLV